MNTKIIVFLMSALLASFFLVGNSTSLQDKQKPALVAVDNLNLDRYLGSWYEISAIPIFWELACKGSKAEYTKVGDVVEIKNSCNLVTLKGPVMAFSGKLKSDGNKASELCVTFNFNPFVCAPYWIIGLDEVNYSYAVVGSPSRDYLWILSRTPQMDESLYNQLVQSAKNQDFDVSRLKKTAQPQN